MSCSPVTGANGQNQKASLGADQKWRLNSHFPELSQLGVSDMSGIHDLELYLVLG
jgi:hypothetical protein